LRRKQGVEKNKRGEFIPILLPGAQMIVVKVGHSMGIEVLFPYVKEIDPAICHK
jgi:hypothetical protein